MHHYETDGRARVVIVIFAFSMLLVWILYEGMTTIDFDPPWWVSLPSFAGFYSILRWLFDRHLWRFGFLRSFGFIRLPDLNGNWVGEVASSYNEYGNPYPVRVDIVQRWSEMAITLETEQSRSRSTVASLKAADLVNPELSYQYLNEPKSSAPGTMAIHRGTANLELVEDCLEGDYYTGRGRGEIGSMKLRRL